LFLISLATLAYYVKATVQIPNPDVSQDWNVFLESFSKLEFCVIHQNSSSSESMQLSERPAWWPGSYHAGNDKRRKTRSYSVSMPATIRPTKEFVSNRHSMTYLMASMSGKYIGLKGDALAQKFNITMTIPYQWSALQCSDNPLHNCDSVSAEICVEFRGQVDMFPADLHPKPCSKASRSMPHGGGTEYWAGLNWQVVDMDSLSYCRSKTMISVVYSFDPKLSKTLQDRNREVSKSHLLNTCYVLLIFVMLVVIYGTTFKHTRDPVEQKMPNVLLHL